MLGVERSSSSSSTRPWLGSEQFKGTEGELMSQELADFKVDSLAGDDEEDEGIPGLENVVDLIFDAL